MFVFFYHPNMDIIWEKNTRIYLNFQSLITKKSVPWACDLCLITSVAKNLYFVKNLTLKIVSYWESTKVTNTLKNEPGQSHQQNMVMTFLFEKSCLELRENNRKIRYLFDGVTFSS